MPECGCSAIIRPARARPPVLACIRYAYTCLHALAQPNLIRMHMLTHSRTACESMLCESM